MTMPLPIMVGMHKRVYVRLKGKPKRKSIRNKEANMRSEEEIRQMIEHLGIVAARLDYIDGEADRVIGFGLDMLNWVLGVDVEEEEDDLPEAPALPIEFVQCGVFNPEQQR